MSRLKRLLWEPLFHFLVLGGLIFVLFNAVSEPALEPVDIVVIGPERIEQLSTGYQAAWQRPPSADELNGLIDDAVREEIYYREALALGLDSNDTVIRRRLRQKMEFLTEAGADILKPVAGELKAHLIANENTFQRGPHLAFEQIYLGQNPGRARIEQALNALQSGSAADPAKLGDRTLLPAQLGLSLPAAIDGVFGENFFAQLSKLAPQLWAGPVTSAYGVHLVRISESFAARTPPLQEIREDVLQDWKAAKVKELRALHFARLRERYEVDIRRAETETAEGR